MLSEAKEICLSLISACAFSGTMATIGALGHRLLLKRSLCSFLVRKKSVYKAVVSIRHGKNVSSVSSLNNVGWLPAARKGSDFAEHLL